MSSNYDEFLKHLKIVEEASKPIKNEDEHWKTVILEILFACYEQQKEVIKTAVKSFNGKGQIEDFIKDNMHQWLKNTKKYARNLPEISVIVNQESKTTSHKEGYYDLKFQHSSWNSYYSFECKCLTQRPVSIKEYIYNPKSKKGKDDGGVYRYAISKYADRLNFGGMIGFILSGNETLIINNICTALEKFELQPDKAGKLANPVKRNAIASNQNTFESVHFRRDAQNQITENITLIHIIMDFS